MGTVHLPNQKNTQHILANSGPPLTHSECRNSQPNGNTARAATGRVKVDLPELTEKVTLTGLPQRSRAVSITSVIRKGAVNLNKTDVGTSPAKAGQSVDVNSQKPVRKVVRHLNVDASVAVVD